MAKARWKSCPTVSASCAARRATTCPAPTTSTSARPRCAASACAPATRVEGQIRAPKDGERYFALLKVNTINFEPPDAVRHRINFDNLTPLYPDQRIKLEIEIPRPAGQGRRPAT